MPEITRIAKINKHEKPRVCAYVRVSTDSEEQLHSYAVQKEYWDGKFSNNDSVVYLGMYSDEGISGYKTTQRKGFQAVMRLAREGKIDTVYTKSFTRFCRNMVDGLDSIEVLREFGVNVIFEKESIDSFDPNSRFTLNLLARVAEEDIHSISKNITLSIRHRIQNGKVLVTGVYGYYSAFNEKTREYELTIKPDEAKVVRLIFQMYLEGKGVHTIAKYLTAQGYPSPRSKGPWPQETVKCILANEKYIGDTIMQKTYTENFVRKDNKNLDPDVPMVLISNTHEPIISREDFEKAKAIREERAAAFCGDTTKRNPVYSFTSKIKCADCGANYTHQVVHYNRKPMYHLWTCHSRLKYADRINCKNPSVKDSEVRRCFAEAYEECCKTKIAIEDATGLELRRSTLLDAEKELNMMVVRKHITKEQFNSEMADILKELTIVEGQIAEIKRRSNRVDLLREGETIDDAVRKYLDKVIVKNRTLTFVFINGFQTIRRYDNGKPGGQKGNNNTVKNKKRVNR